MILFNENDQKHSLGIFSIQKHANLTQDLRKDNVPQHSQLIVIHGFCITNIGPNRLVFQIVQKYKQ